MRLFRLDETLSELPRPATSKWPDGVRDLNLLERHGLTVSLFAPRGVDHQSPHSRDELYVIAQGASIIVVDGERVHVAAGDAILVEAGVVHRFEQMSEEFSTWVVFFGPIIGSRAAGERALRAGVAVQQASEAARVEKDAQHVS